MADGLHDISLAIGELKSDMASSQRQRADLFDKIDGVKDDVSAIREMMAPLATVPAHIKSHCDDLKTLAGYVQWIRGAWAAIVVVAGLLVTAAGTAVWLFNVYKADQDNRLRQIERAMPRSLYPDVRP
jgi:hypothetical protein